MSRERCGAGECTPSLRCCRASSMTCPYSGPSETWYLAAIFRLTQRARPWLVRRGGHQGFMRPGLGKAQCPRATLNFEFVCSVVFRPSSTYTLPLNRYIFTPSLFV